MRHAPHRLMHPRGMARRFLEWARGHEQILVRGGADQPLLLVSYPRGSGEEAMEVEAAYVRTLPSLSAKIAGPYLEMLHALPPIVVVLLHPLNECGCLGHYHPRGAESRLARRLSGDLGSPIGEVDLAFEGIRQWQPQPLSRLAAAESGAELPRLHFRAALLSVLLHELEHLAYPERQEREVRGSSDQFYSAVMRELVMQESGVDYGMASSQ